MTRPMADLPEAARPSGSSNPWSIELRIKCTKGSLSRSMTVLSSSVSSPIVTSSIFLPRSRARSWIRRRKRPNSDPMGSIRTPMVESRSSSARRSISSATDLTAGSAQVAAICRRRDCAITSSPTRSMSSSSRSAGTRMLAWARSARAAVFWFCGSGGAATAAADFAGAGKGVA